jgi:hypothetical protein
MQFTESEQIQINTESQRIMNKYPGYYPIYCYSEDFDLPKNKYLVSGSMIFGQFVYVVKKKLKLRSSEALFFLIKNKAGEIVPLNNEFISSIWVNNCHPDLGCIYVQIVKENTFGN